MSNQTMMVPKSEKLCYGFGMLGTNLTFGLLSSYLLIYLTDVFFIAPAAIGVLILVARLWDAINDPLMGVIADKTRTRFGRFRPYIFISAFILPLFTYLVFMNPSLNYTGKIVYAYITYIGWGMAYTMADIPKWSIVSVLTSNKQERVNIIAIAKILGMIGVIGVNIMVIPMVSLLGKGDQATGYRYTALIIAILVMISSLLMFFATHERVPASDHKPTFKESLSAIGKNKPLLLLLAGMFIMSAVMMVGQTLQIHYITYNLGNQSLVPLITILSLIPTLLGAGTSGLLTKKWGNKVTYIISLVGIFVRGVCMYIVGYETIVPVITVMAIGGYFFGVANVVGVAMVTDTIDYIEKKMGHRNEGVIFSAQTFVTKLSGAVGGSAAALALTIAGYQERATQTVITLDWIHAFMSIIPALFALIAIVPIVFYRVDR